VNHELESVRIGDQMLAIYESKDASFDEAFSFLKMGFENNEVVMLVTEEMMKGEARERMQKECDIDLKALETADNIILMTPQEWYFPKNKRPDKSRLLRCGLH
jgi:hypothetical protein